ncbi:oocyte-secreted protein 4A isoform X3 [Bubalus kerabau]|uniref:oocyte-secreted protein 4A isoform X3 n=1 Tax=Bubalus carabanensis TaxID=3119969 RepID=UPI00244E64D0|nr:oocyte-secreted protein 4A isoform X3 [Bubalus carabanensis]
MKASAVLAGLLVLFLLIRSLDNWSVTCAKNWLQVKVRRTPFVDELLFQVHELFLGDGCPVTTELPDSFEFLYGLTTCGIRTYESSWGILIESSVTYGSLFINRGGVMPVLCFVKRNDPFTFGEEDIESDNETSGENAQGPGRQKNTPPPEAPSLEPPPGMPCKSEQLRRPDAWRVHHPRNSSSLVGVCNFFFNPLVLSERINP